MTQVGLMLYTVRGDCERDLAAALRGVSALGFAGVELHSLYGHDAGGVRRLLDTCGLHAVGRHASLVALESALPGLVEEVQVLGTDRLAVSWIDPPPTAAEADTVVARIAAVAQAAHERGVRLGFHNHWSELAPLDDGRSVLDRLRELPPELLWLELDLGWAWEAGADPLELLRDVGPRAPLLHVKDLRGRGTREHCPVGDGSVGYERVLPAAVDAGAEWLLVEQDEVDGPSLDAVARSLAAVQRMLAVAA